MNKDEYLNAMRSFPCGNPLPLDQTPPAWFAEAWEIDQVREEQTADIARTVRKVGELFYTPEFLGLLARSLNSVRLVELYAAIRDQSRREQEFRAGFEQAFPAIVADLPPPKELERWDFQKAMCSAIEARDLPRVKLQLRYMRERDIPIASLRFTEYETQEFTPEEIQGMGEEDIERYIRLVESPPTSVRTCSAVEYAESLGAADIVGLLRSAE